MITRGYPDLALQIEACEVADYDPTGWCDVRILTGPPARTMSLAQGPKMIGPTADVGFVEILLWTNAAGMLYSIEVVEYGLRPLRLDGTAPYQLFIDADLAPPPRLEWTSAADGGWS